MKFKDINKIGFYVNPKDTDREIIFEVFKNTDTVWLKEEPEAKLLVDTWFYSHTDTDDIKHYKVSGTLTILRRKNPEDDFIVEEITDTKYIVENLVMHEDKLTYKQKYEKYKNVLDEIEEICKKSWHDSGITIDYFKRNNYSWKQHQIRSLISRFEQIIQKIKEIKNDKN